LAALRRLVLRVASMRRSGGALLSKPALGRADARPWISLLASFRSLVLTRPGRFTARFGILPTLPWRASARWC
jgi:hypothetical protein